MEQVAEAAADVKALDLSFTIVSEIRKKFPDSQRASRITVRNLARCKQYEIAVKRNCTRAVTYLHVLQAIYFEAKGKFTEGEQVLEKLLEDRPDSHYAFKRRV